MTARVLPLGEGAWTVTLGERLDAGLHAQVTALAEAVRSAQLPGVLDIVPAYVALTVFFDPLKADAERLRERLASLAAGKLPALPPEAGRLHRIPVRYNGPDLDPVAERTGLPRDEVIARHAAPEYRVYLLGFSPGFAYLGDLDSALVLPRRSAPRARVPAGAVAIAGPQTGIYPAATPGGWHLIGSTEVRPFDPSREPAALFRPGDRVRFEPVP